MPVYQVGVVVVVVVVVDFESLHSRQDIRRQAERLYARLSCAFGGLSQISTPLRQSSNRLLCIGMALGACRGAGLSVLQLRTRSKRICS